MPDHQQAGGSFWTARSVWADVAPPAHIGPAGKTGVKARCVAGIGMASLIVPGSGKPALMAQFEANFRLSLPATPQIVEHGGVRAVWAGPDQWLLLTDRTGGIEPLRQALSGFGAIADQSDSRVVLQLSGVALREALAKGCMIDLHGSAFPVGAAALTSIAHIGVHLWRLADGPDGAVFELAVARSMAGSFWSWFSASVAEFGCSVTVS